MTTLTHFQNEKCINQSFLRDENERAKVAHNAFSDDIPVISLCGIDSDLKRDEVRRKITEACESWGIFQVVGHGVDSNLVSEMARLCSEFFNLPTQEKQKFGTSEGKQGSFFVSTPLKYASNGRFTSAEHRAVVNSNTGRLSIATFQYPTAEATVFPLTTKEGEKPIMDEAITFAEMYRRKFAEYVEPPRLKKLVNESDEPKLLPKAR